MPTLTSKGALLIRPTQGQEKSLERVKQSLQAEASARRSSVNALALEVLQAHVAGLPAGALLVDDEHTPLTLLIQRLGSYELAVVTAAANERKHWVRIRQATGRWPEAALEALEWESLRLAARGERVGEDLARRHPNGPVPTKRDPATIDDATAEPHQLVSKHGLGKAAELLSRRAWSREVSASAKSTAAAEDAS
jgi:hypothetical protein